MVLSHLTIGYLLWRIKIWIVVIAVYTLNVDELLHIALRRLKWLRGSLLGVILLVPQAYLLELLINKGIADRWGCLILLMGVLVWVLVRMLVHKWVLLGLATRLVLRLCLAKASHQIEVISVLLILMDCILPVLRHKLILLALKLLLWRLLRMETTLSRRKQFHVGLHWHSWWHFLIVLLLSSRLLLWIR